MPTEIERKFLVTGDDWRELAQAVRYRQGYLLADKERTVRVRTVGDTGYITIKGQSNGISRLEYEYKIPVTEAEEMLQQLCQKPLIEKNRTTIPYKGFHWEVDEFFGENKGLIIAEIELATENQPFDKPDWIGREVSDDPRYFNACLAQTPFSRW